MAAVAATPLSMPPSSNVQKQPSVPLQQILDSASVPINQQGGPLDQPGAQQVFADSTSQMIPVRWLIERTNTFLRESSTEQTRERFHAIHELELLLHITRHECQYHFLEAEVKDTSRRQYMIPTKLAYVPMARHR